MYKKLILLFLCIVLFCFDIPSAECGKDDVIINDQMIEILTGNLSTLFPISSQKQNFMTPAEALYSDVGKETMVRMETESGVRNIAIYANADSIHDYSGVTTIDDAYPTDFQFTMDVTVRDIYPDAQGGCFIGFTDYGISDTPGHSDAEMIALSIDGLSAEMYVKKYEADSGSHYSLGEMVRNASKLSIVHLMGHTYVYINGRYLGQYHDGKTGGFQLIFGSSVYKDGDTASCTFDNLQIRKVSNQ